MQPFDTIEFGGHKQTYNGGAPAPIRSSNFTVI